MYDKYIFIPTGSTVLGLSLEEGSPGFGPVVCRGPWPDPDLEDPDETREPAPDETLDPALPALALRLAIDCEGFFRVYDV